MIFLISKLSSMYNFIPCWCLVLDVNQNIITVSFDRMVLQNSCLDCRYDFLSVIIELDVRFYPVWECLVLDVHQNKNYCEFSAKVSAEFMCGGIYEFSMPKPSCT